MMGYPDGIHTIEFLKVTPSFTFVHKPPALYQIREVSGLVDERNFPYPKFTNNEEQYSSQYISHFGPSFYISNTHFPGKGSEEIVTGVSRLIGLRKPLKIGYCQRLSANNNAIPKYLRGFFTRYKAHYCSMVHHQLYDVAYEDWLHQPHTKRKLRRTVHQQHWQFLDGDKDMSRPIEAKLKPGEVLASAGKARMIADLGVNNTQITACQIAACKEAMIHPYTLGCHESRFIGGPDHDILSDTFTWLSNPSNDGGIRFAYFSDDCSASCMCSDGPLIFNGDISQCDGSHRLGLFNVVKDILTTDVFGNYHSASHSILQAFSLLGNSFNVRNPFEYKEKVQYKFMEPKLYSGSSLTTIINNFANLSIFFSMVKLAPDTRIYTRDQMAKLYVKAAENVGYIVKCSLCERIEQLQFLKHFPCLGSDGQYHAIMSLGTFFKGFGRVYGDISPAYGTKEVPLQVRLARYNRDVAVSRLGWGNHDINSAFDAITKPHCGYSDNSIREVLTNKSTGGFRDVSFSLANLSARYSCDTDDLIELVEKIKSSTLGTFVKLPILDTIYQMDYG